MDNQDLEIFREICQTKNIGKAAENLYLAPSTVSERLKLLEKELGFTLALRHKGRKTVTITSRGEEFRTIAAEILDLMESSRQLKDQGLRHNLRIATADSFLQYNLTDFYSQLLFERRDYRLDIQLYTSDRIYRALHNRDVDIGFTLFEMNYSDILTTPLFHDDTVVLVPESSEIRGTVRPGDLDPEKEIFVGSTSNRFVGWGEAFNTWRDSVIDNNKTPLLTTNTISVMSYFLSGDDYWSFLPRTCCEGFARSMPVRIVEIEGNKPERCCYMLQRKKLNAYMEQVLADFQKLLYAYLRKRGFAMEEKS